MKIRLSRFLTSAFILPASLLATQFATAPSAQADRPWQDVKTPAVIHGEYSLSQPLASVITSLPDGSPFTLGETGKLYRIDPVDGHLTSLTDELPPLTALTANTQGIWAITQAPKPELLNIAPDSGVILNHVGIGKALANGSHITTLQVAEGKAFLVDGGAPAFIIIDLKSGRIQRLLEGVPSLSGHNLLIRHGKQVTTADGREETGGNVRFMVLDRKREWLFYQAPTGPLYRIGTNLLTDPSLGPAERIEGMANWRRTPSLGGLTIDNKDTLYMVDIDHGDLLAFGTDRIPLRLLHDDRLYGAEAAAILKGNAGRHRRLAILLAPQPATTQPAAAQTAIPSDTGQTAPDQAAESGNAPHDQSTPNQNNNTSDTATNNGQDDGDDTQSGPVAPLPADNHYHLLEITLP